MADLRVGYFLEDIAHEQFITALTKRVAEEVGLSSKSLEFVIRNASGGKGRVMTELRRFLRAVQRGRLSGTPVLIVAVDGNCQGYAEKRDEILSLAERYEYRGRVVCAVPDPHVERWYIADPGCLQRVLRTAVAVELPARKCERGLYKRILRAAFAEAGIRPPLGGAEYGGDIAREMDLYVAQQNDRALKHFVDELKEALSSLC